MFYSFFLSPLIGTITLTLSLSLISETHSFSFSLNFPLSKLPWPILSHRCSPLATATVVFLHSLLQSLSDLTHFCSILLSLFALHWVKSQLNPTTTTTVVYGNGYWRSSIFTSFDRWVWEFIFYSFNLWVWGFRFGFQMYLGFVNWKFKWVWWIWFEISLDLLFVLLWV